jgi:hypothetical protein
MITKNNFIIYYFLNFPPDVLLSDFLLFKVLPLPVELYGVLYIDKLTPVLFKVPLPKD